MGLLPSMKVNRSMGVLLAGILVFHAGWYMVLPYFAILFTSRRGLSPAQVGVVLAMQSVSLLVGSLAGGMLSDRMGHKRTILLGLVIRAVGLVLLGLGLTLPALLGAAAVSGLGGGLYGPAAKAAIALMAGPGDRSEAFSLRGVAANIGTSTGPLLGTLLVRGSMPVLFGIAGGLHLLLGGLTWTLMRRTVPAGGEPREAAGAGGETREAAGAGGETREAAGWQRWRAVLADRPYLAFSLVTVLGWALFTQLALAMPLYARDRLGLEQSIGLLWTISSLAVILFQVPLTNSLLSRMQPMRVMAIGSVLLGGGLAAIGLARSFTGLLAAVLLFVLGEMFLLPTADSTVSLLAAPAAVGTYFGVASFTWGLGEGLGNLTGGALMQAALKGGLPALPWPIYGAVGLVLGALYALLHRQQSMQSRLRPPAAEPGRTISVYQPEATAPSPSDQVELGPPGGERGE